LLSSRLLSAALILAPVLTVFWLDYAHNFGHPGIWLWPLAIAIAAAGVGELLTLLSRRATRPRPWVVQTGAVATLVLAGLPIMLTEHGGGSGHLELSSGLGGLLLAMLLVLVYEMRHYQAPGETFERTGVGLFCVFYVAAPLCFLIALRRFGHDEVGAFALLSLLVIVKMSDAGAYTFGRLFGRRRIAPTLSPGKSLEGVVGGAATAGLVAAGLFALVAQDWKSRLGINVSLISAGVYGVMIALVGVVGDVAESMLKRDSGRKDSSSWLPGLGGVLDIFDSILVTAPLAYWCWSLGWLASGVAGEGAGPLASP